VFVLVNQGASKISNWGGIGVELVILRPVGAKN